MQPYELTVSEAVSEIAAHQLSPVELATSLLERYAEVESQEIGRAHV